MIEKLERLADLESNPLRTPRDLLEWNELRNWVLLSEERLEAYRELDLWSRSEEITKVQRVLEKLYNLILF